MIPRKPSQPSQRATQTTRKDVGPSRARRALLLGAVTPLILVGGCTTSLPSDTNAQSEPILALPALSATEELRDEIVRVDAAVAKSAAGLHLPDVELAAEQRLEAGGGLWDPWVDVDFEERPNLVVEQPMSLESAPSGEEELAEFMLETGAAQLQLVSTSPGLTASERLALASILSGRVVSGAALQVSSGKTPTATPYLGLFDDVEVEALPQSGSQLDTGQSGTLSEAPGLSNVQESSALNVYDCVASSLLRVESSKANTIPGVRKLATKLEQRVVLLREMGAYDARGPRCIYADATADELLQQLVYTDLELLESESFATRALAAKYLFQDSVLWAKIAPTKANQVSLLLDRPTSLDNSQSGDGQTQSADGK